MMAKQNTFKVRNIKEIYKYIWVWISLSTSLCTTFN